MVHVVGLADNNHKPEDMTAEKLYPPPFQHGNSKISTGKQFHELTNDFPGGRWPIQ